MAAIGVVRLRVSGCGQNLDLEFESSTKVGAVLDAVAERAGGGLTRRHVKLLFRGKQLGEGGTDTMSLESAGVRDRTKLMAMHTKEYHAEKSVIAALDEFSRQVDGIADPTSVAGQEYLTQIICKLDGVDAQGSDFLRARRKALVKRIEALSEGR
mmetsp:Transcript_17707/g.55264  ORF Transcript_17707/g.55264 Transcript_17707/m.55264 type:complete len:155 (-) Transcript_17707:12-476(-)